MHPGAFFTMRSERTASNHAHQAAYTTNGKWIRSGVSAGTADRFAATEWGNMNFNHVRGDVNPFVMAAQLDGNPCDKSGVTMTASILYEGHFVKQYLAVRPPVANNRAPLPPNMCAP